MTAKEYAKRIHDAADELNSLMDRLMDEHHAVQVVVRLSEVSSPARRQHYGKDEYQHINVSIAEEL